MAWKKRKVSGPSAAPPVAAERSLVKPSRSRSARNSSASATAERRPRFSAPRPIRIPSANMPRLSGEASMTRARTSAASDSHTRGAKSTKFGPISRKSAMVVSGSSTKFTRIRAISPQPRT